MTAAERHYTLQFRAAHPERPILECYWDARRHINFRERLSASVKEHAKRSKAAKKAWKSRKAAMQ
jgi:hypothetical protein